MTGMNFNYQQIFNTPWSNFNTFGQNNYAGEFQKFVPNFNTTFTPMFSQASQFAPFSWGNTFSSSSNCDETTFEGKLEKQKSEAKAKREKLEQQKKVQEFELEKHNALKTIDEQINVRKDIVETINKSKNKDGKYVFEKSVLNSIQQNEDGTIKKVEPQKGKKKSKSYWKKWGLSAGTALINMGKSLVGYDEKGNWSLKKCLTNAAVAIGATALMIAWPPAGAIMLAGGVLSGGIGVVKGASKLDRATTEVEKEKARQEICSGAFIGITSALGLKGMGKAFRTSSATSNMASVAKTRSFVGKPIEYVSQLGRDIFVNSYRSAKYASAAQKTTIATNGGGVKGFWKTFKSDMMTTLKSFNNHQKKYDNKLNEMEGSLRNKIAELDSKISVEADAAKKVLLEEQKAMLQNNLDEIQIVVKTTAKTKQDFDYLKGKNSSYDNTSRYGSYSSNGSSYEINGQTVSKKAFEKFVKTVEAEQKAYNNNLAKLIKLKENQMRSYVRKSSGPEKQAVDEYTSASIRSKYTTRAEQEQGITDLTAKIATETDPVVKATLENELAVVKAIKFRKLTSPSRWLQNDALRYIGGSNSGFLKELCGLPFSKPMLAPLVVSQWDRPISMPMFGDVIELSKEQAEESITKYEQEVLEYEKRRKQIDEIKTVEDMERLNAEIAAQAEAQAQAAAQQQAQTSAEAQKG